MGKYTITRNTKGKYHFDLCAPNGEVILSSQMYMARKGALKGVRSTVKNAKKAPIEDRTAKVVKTYGNPKFVITCGKDKKFYFSLIAANGKDVGTSQGYKTMAACKAGIASVKKNSTSEIEKPARKTAAKKAAPKKAAKKVVKKAAPKKAVKKVAKKAVKKVAKKAKKK